MSKIFVKAQHSRRRAGIRFQEGMNGPFEKDELNEKGLAAIEADPVLAIVDGDGKSEKPPTPPTPPTMPKPPKGGAGKKPKGKKKSAAEQNADKAAAEKRVATINEALTKVSEPQNATIEGLSEIAGFDVTKEELETALKTLAG